MCRYFNAMLSKIHNALNQINTTKYNSFYIAGNIYNFGFSIKDTQIFSQIFLSKFQKKIGRNKDLFVPTATLNLIENGEKFSSKNTKSYMMGIFSEFVRKKKLSYRSNHPLWSFAGLGKNVKKVLKDTSYSAYGKDSVFDRLLKRNTLFISMGKPHKSLGMLHYAEHVVGVPYRFNKEFKIKIQNKNKVKKQYCLLGVRFNSNKLAKDENKKIVMKLKQKKVFKIIKLNKGELYCADYNLLVSELINILNNNPKIWLKNEKIIQKKYIDD